MTFSQDHKFRSRLGYCNYCHRVTAVFLNLRHVKYVISNNNNNNNHDDNDDDDDDGYVVLK